VTRTGTRTVLVLSTTPPIPRDYGNRNRVHQTIAFFRSRGFAPSLLLYPLDRDWVDEIPAYYRKLKDDFDYFALLPNSKPLHQPAAGYHHQIDEWWDETIGQHLSWLCARKRFDAVLVNYTFLSKAFEYVPADVLRILDTHDLFSGRRELFAAHGVEPEFFYTTPEREKVALERADLVIAIKQSEAAMLRQLTSRRVVCIPYWDGRPPRPRPHYPADVSFDHEQPLRLGFLGAHNSVNIVNLRRFLAVLNRYVRTYDAPIEIVTGGNACDGIGDDYEFVTKIGYVEDPETFYRDIDAVVVPLQFSTGIKIKVGEALARHLPVLATANAFDGFRPYHWTQHADDIHALCEGIVAVAYGEIAWTELAAAARQAAMAAALAQERGFGELASWIDECLGPVVRACRQLLSCVQQPAAENCWTAIIDEAKTVSRDDRFRARASECAGEICRVLGYPEGDWGLAEKMFREDFDLVEQVGWIVAQVEKRERGMHANVNLEPQEAAAPVADVAQRV
jgi:glycosyltransferase involved in cell wall biosynthesis